MDRTTRANSGKGKSKARYLRRCIAEVLERRAYLSAYELNSIASFVPPPNGAFPRSTPVMDSSGDLFATTYSGGQYNDGAVFEIAHGTTSITTVTAFNNTNGANPEAGLVFDSSGDLFGTTDRGGANGVGKFSKSPMGRLGSPRSPVSTEPTDRTRKQVCRSTAAVISSGPPTAGREQLRHRL